MKINTMLIAPITGLLLSMLIAAGDPRTKQPTPTEKPDAKALSILHRVAAAENAATTLSADFTYTVSSVKQQQLVTGNVRLMKPNLARIAFSYMAQPAFPNVVASDGIKVTTFTPSSFLPDRTFAPGPFDPISGTQSASGLKSGGGTFSTEPADPAGANIHLWDSVAADAFFGAEHAIRSYVYVRDMNELKYDGEQTVNGVVYQVLKHHIDRGRIAGGEETAFDQRLYVGADDLIHMYILEFTSGGRSCIEIMKLDNIKLNEQMKQEDFAFTLPKGP